MRSHGDKETNLREERAAGQQRSDYRAEDYRRRRAEALARWREQFLRDQAASAETDPEFFGSLLPQPTQQDGFFMAPREMQCVICLVAGEKAFIAKGEWIRRMPDSYHPRRRHRVAHERCVRTLAQLIWETTGIRVVV